LQAMHAIRHPVIPAPVRFDGGRGEFTFRPGTTIAYTNTGVLPIIERFSAEVTRRTGLGVLPMAGNPGSNEQSVRIELATGGEFAALPAPRGVSPLGDGLPDERHSLTIDQHQVVVHAAEPAGVARGLTTLIQLLAAAQSVNGGEASLPGARILEASPGTAGCGRRTASPTFAPPPWTGLARSRPSP
jgi:hypothetical protein